MTCFDKHKGIIEEFRLLSCEPLRKYTSFRVGGPADLLALPASREELVKLLQAAKKLGLPVNILGGGSNVLVSDKGIDGLVIVLKQLKSGIVHKQAGKGLARLTMDAGERLSSVLNFAMAHDLSGLEFAAGIPGTIGGAVMMNAGSVVRGIGDFVESIDVINLNTLAFETIERKNLNFSYRSLGLSDSVIVGVTLELKQGDPLAIKKDYDKNLKYKNQNQPVSWSSAGCFFKNPAPTMPAGKLIEDAGLKGRKFNNAQVSEIHANFIVNTGNASFKDIIALKKLVQTIVFKEYQIKLETEVKVLGDE